MKFGGITGKLRHVYLNYKPGYFQGTIEYFQASKNPNAVTKNPEYWKNKADNLNLHRIDCYHNQLLVGEYAEKVTNEISITMDRYEENKKMEKCEELEGST